MRIRARGVACPNAHLGSSGSVPECAIGLGDSSPRHRLDADQTLRGRAMRVDIVTIFPDYFGAGQPSEGFGGAGPLGVSLIGKAGARGDIDFRVHDLRQWATDVHHTVDDTPFGGGPGMVMKPDVWGRALDAVLSAAPAPDPSLTAAPAPMPDI